MSLLGILLIAVAPPVYVTDSNADTRKWDMPVRSFADATVAEDHVASRRLNGASLRTATQQAQPASDAEAVPRRALYGAPAPVAPAPARQYVAPAPSRQYVAPAPAAASASMRPTITVTVTWPNFHRQTVTQTSVGYTVTKTVLVTTTSTTSTTTTTTVKPWSLMKSLGLGSSMHPMSSFNLTASSSGIDESPSDLSIVGLSRKVLNRKVRPLKSFATARIWQWLVLAFALCCCCVLCCCCCLGGRRREHRSSKRNITPEELSPQAAPPAQAQELQQVEAEIMPLLPPLGLPEQYSYAPVAPVLPQPEPTSFAPLLPPTPTGVSTPLMDLLAPNIGPPAASLGITMPTLPSLFPTRPSFGSFAPTSSATSFSATPAVSSFGHMPSASSFTRSHAPMPSASSFARSQAPMPSASSFTRSQAPMPSAASFTRAQPVLDVTTPALTAPYSGMPLTGTASVAPGAYTAGAYATPSGLQPTAPSLLNGLQPTSPSLLSYGLPSPAAASFSPSPAYTTQVAQQGLYGGRYS